MLILLIPGFSDTGPGAVPVVFLPSGLAAGGNRAEHEVQRHQSAAPGSQAEQRSPVTTVLVVDDDPNIREVLRDVLEFEGYEVVTAANGQEALAAVERHLPAVMLLDLRMPVLDGWAVARVLRERGLDVPLVIMTAAQDARAWAAETGAYYFLAKPFEVGALIDVVDQLSGRT